MVVLTGMDRMGKPGCDGAVGIGRGPRGKGAMAVVSRSRGIVGRTMLTRLCSGLECCFLTVDATGGVGWRSV